MSELSFKYEHKIQYYETDKMGITHHSNYVRFMEEGRIAFLEHIGFSYDKFEELGYVSPVVNISCDYKKTTTYPNIVDIKLKVLELSRIKFRFAYTMKVDGEIVFNGTSTHCILNRNGKPQHIEKNFPEFYKVLCKYTV